MKKTSVILNIPASVACTCMALAMTIEPLNAADQTWTNTGSNSNWSDVDNWGGNPAPGATTGTNNTDEATFNSAVGTVGTVGNPIVIDSASQNIKNIFFTGNVGSYSIGSTGGNPLYMSSNGYIEFRNNATNTTDAIQNINAPLVSTGEVLNLVDSAKYSGTGSGQLNVNGSITTLHTSNAKLVIKGTNTRSVISGVISDGASPQLTVLKDNGGTWKLTGENTFTGDVGIYNGALIASSIADKGVASALGAGDAIGIGKPGNQYPVTLKFDGASGGSSNRDIVVANHSGGLGGGGTIENVVAGQTLTLSGAVTVGNPSSAATLNLAGVGNGVLSGTVADSPALSITKEGSGTWELSGTKTYTGTTTAIGGTLLVNTTIGSGAVDVNNAGSVLGGNGIVGGETTLASGALLSAGASAGATGTLTFQNGLDLSAASGSNSEVFQFDLGLLGDSDSVVVSGGVLDVGILNVENFDFNTISGFGAGDYTLFDASATIIGSVGTSELSLDGYSGTLWIDGINNNVMFSVIPEPSMTMTLMGLVSFFFCLRRRR